MPEVSVGTDLLPRDGDEFYEHERACWKYWQSLDTGEQELIMATVREELERLIGTIENWLPASGRIENGALDIRIRIWPNEIGGSSPLTPLEKRKADEVVDQMKEMLKDLE